MKARELVSKIFICSIISDGLIFDASPLCNLVEEGFDHFENFIGAFLCRDLWSEQEEVIRVNAGSCLRINAYGLMYNRHLKRRFLLLRTLIGMCSATG